ncbi:MAG: TonB-dependent receptor [Pyrinomonadaceae bacterium]|nr:TonB-dependent receptor [Pyrinomonadaceae bacterium]
MESLALQRRLLMVLCAVLFLLNTNNTTVHAQDLDDVTITGKVTDTNGAALPNATVTATLVTETQERTVTTNEDGRFRIIELKPGSYIVKVEASGFAILERTNLTTISGQNVQLNLELSPANVLAQTIIVDDSSTPAVDTTRTIVGGTVTQLEVEELPNNTRSPLDLVFTLGGVSEEQLSTRDLSEDRNSNAARTPLEQGNFSLSGGTAFSNNLTIDGFDNNDDRSSRERFQPSLEGVAEVQVISNQFSAEYGRASGGRVNIRTRAGGNKFRGRAFMFFRDDNLNANTYYNNSRGFARVPLTEYNPGFTFSGPVILPFGEGKSIYNGTNRTFFSVAYEYNKLLDNSLIDAYVPLVANPRYTLPASTGGVPTCDTNNSDPAPCTATTPTAGFVVQYTFTLATPNSNNVLSARIDHKLTSSNDVTFGLQFGRRNNRRTNTASLTRIENALQETNNNTEAYNFTDNQVFGARAVNQFRIQYSNFQPSFQTQDPLDPVVLIGYRNPVTNAIQTLVAGNSTTSTSQGFPDSRKETRFQVLDALTYVAGSHTLKGGFDVQKVRSKTLGLGDATGTFNFGSVLNYQQNVVTRFRQNFGTQADVRNTYYGVFLNDEYRIFPNLTVSYGVRYERETALSDSNNFGPRLGIAYAPFKDGKGVIRVGAGIFYNRALLRTVGDSIQNTSSSLVSFDSNTIGTNATDPRRGPILAAIARQFPNSYPSVADLRTLVASSCVSAAGFPACNTNTGFVTSVTSAGNPLRSVDPTLRIPESYQYNLGFEREIYKGLVFEANYTINKTANLWRDTNSNAPQVPAGFNDFTSYLLANPYTFTAPGSTTVRTYRFYLGSTTDGSGTSSTQGGTAACSTGTGTCFVNLNSTNSTDTTPTIAVPGATNNAVGTPVGIATAAVARFRPDQTISETSVIRSIGNAFYQGLILELRSRNRNFGYGFGGSLRIAYTLSSTKDDGLNNTSNAEVNGDFRREYARSLQDRRNRLAVSGVFNTPYWLGGLRFSPLVRFGSSAPFNLGVGGSDRNLDDLGTDRVNFNGDVNDIQTRNPGSTFPTALVSQFSLQPIGSRGGNLPRNAGRGPNLFTFDLSVTKEIKMGERIRIRPTAQFDNILNTTVFSYGSEFIDFTALRGDGTPPTAAQITNFNNFLVPQRTFRQRQIRVGLRFDF